MKLRCPNCESEALRVTETRQAPTTIYRTRKCQACKWSYTTHETVADDGIPRIYRRPKEYELDISAP